MLKTKICDVCFSSFVPLESESTCAECSHNKINKAMDDFEKKKINKKKV